MKDLCITLWNEAAVNEADLMAYLNDRVGCPDNKSWKDDLELGLLGYAEDFSNRHGLGFWPEISPKGKPVLFFWGNKNRFPMPRSEAYFRLNARLIKD